MRSAWLLREGDVVCALDLADTWKERRLGLRARQDAAAGAVHLAGVRTVHGVGLRESIDVAFLADDLTVLRVTRLSPWRFALGRRGASSVLECEAGALERWGVVVGDQLVIREVQ
jgi:uncharacterized membrane protein (UPF0127 family)